MSHKLCCVVTGKCITVSNEYYDKKISEFINEKELSEKYISRQAKSLLKRGYKVKEIRDLLKIDAEKLPDISDKQVKDILKKDNSDEPNFDNVSVKKSDPDVVEYIENLKRI